MISLPQNGFLILINVFQTSMPEAALANVAQNVHGQLRAEGYVLLIEDESSSKFSAVNIPGQGSKHVSSKFRV